MDQEISCVKRISVFPSFLLSLTEVCQDKTRIFFGKQVILPKQPRCNDKMFTSYSIVDHCDCEDLNIWYFTCFFDPIFKLIDFLRMLQVDNESMARFISNKVY